VVRPGDTVNVIGDFVNGKCRIDQRNNLLVVHPDVLIAGSKVKAQ
jgi:DNA replication ATP-dependent helicase Dna2